MITKRILIFSIILSLFMVMVACSDADENSGNDDKAEAYLLVFQQLFESDPALNSEIKYIALDLSEMILETPETLINLLEDFCAEYEFTLLLDTINGLTEKGYIKDLYFEEGIVISFKDKTLTGNKLITDAMKWRSGSGAIGATFIVEKKNDVWMITKTENEWIS